MGFCGILKHTQAVDKISNIQAMRFSDWFQEHDVILVSLNSSKI